MKIFSAIGTNKSKQNCGACAHFQNDATLVEKVYPGLTSMSSGFASVRDMDGFCGYNELYLSARDSCRHFTPRVAEILKSTA